MTVLVRERESIGRHTQREGERLQAHSTGMPTCLVCFMSCETTALPRKNCKVERTPTIVHKQGRIVGTYQPLDMYSSLDGASHARVYFEFCPNDDETARAVEQRAMKIFSSGKENQLPGLLRERTLIRALCSAKTK